MPWYLPCLLGSVDYGLVVEFAIQSIHPHTAKPVTEHPFGYIANIIIENTL